MSNISCAYEDELADVLSQVENAYLHILEYYAAAGEKGFSLIKKSNQLIQKICNDLIDEMLEVKS